MTEKVDSEKIKCLSFHKVRSLVQRGRTENIWLIDVGKYFEANPDIVSEIMQMIDNGEFFTNPVGIMHGLQIRQKSKFQNFIIKKELKHFQIQVLWPCKGEHA